MRKRIIAANWKMNKTPMEAKDFSEALAPLVDVDGVDVVFCVPYVVLCPASKGTKATKNVHLGVQNIHFEDKGAYTGEVSTPMLEHFGVKYAIVGHSERRAYFNETCEDVNKKAKKALQAGLTPIVCVGESLREREMNITIERLRIQVKIAMEGISAQDAPAVVIAYEPIWAIGTGVVATTQQAEEACGAIRQVLAEVYDEPTAQKIRIQYGGSVTADNAAELFAMPNIDGALVGGASLTMDFERIVKA